MQFQNVEISTKDPRTVVLMLGSPETAIICKACEALKKYVEICKLIKTVHTTFHCICILSTIKAESNCLEVKELGALPQLSKLLSSAEKVIRSYAVLCLASMVTNGQSRSIVP